MAEDTSPRSHGQLFCTAVSRPHQHVTASKQAQLTTQSKYSLLNKKQTKLTTTNLIVCNYIKNIRTVLCDALIRNTSDQLSPRKLNSSYYHPYLTDQCSPRNLIFHTTIFSSWIDFVVLSSIYHNTISSSRIELPQKTQFTILQFIALGLTYSQKSQFPILTSLALGSISNRKHNLPYYHL